MATTPALDMSLDDIIKANKKPNPSRSAGPARRFSNRSNNRTTPYSKPVQPSNSSFPVRPASIQTGTKLFISNLDYGVSNEDIKELFAEVGDMKRYTVHYDRSGRSEGTAEVVFARREDAVAAVKRYNNVQLDGKPMKVEIVGTNFGKAVVGLPPSGGFRNQNAGPRGQGRGGGVGRSRGGGRGSWRGGGRGRGGRGRGEKITAEDLDADLEKYHTQSAMEEN